MDSLYPLTFQPVFKERVWGGRRLQVRYGKPLPPLVPIGESWEICDRPGDISIVANGALAGKDLHSLLREFGTKLLGHTPLASGRFPLLIKILDSRDRLSLQVHPPAAKAAVLGGEPKTEFWFIAEAAPNAELYVGLKRGCTRHQFISQLKHGTVEHCFHRVPVKAGDAMFLPSGRVHALGAGMVIFEIQQNSDTTYRVFDWNRLGLDGKPRELHIQQSLESIDFDDFEPELIHPLLIPGSATSASLLKHSLFSVDLSVLQPDERLLLKCENVQIVGLIAGQVQILDDKSNISLGPGTFCLLPACLQDPIVRAVETATILRVSGGQGARP